jgi:hypothetical protein
MSRLTTFYSEASKKRFPLDEFLTRKHDNQQDAPGLLTQYYFGTFQVVAGTGRCSLLLDSYLAETQRDGVNPEMCLGM